MKKLSILLAIIFLVTAASAQTIPWFYAPTNEVHPCGNNYMEFQDYSGGASSYYHDGIDIMAGYGDRPVFAVADGVVTHISTGTMYGGIMIGEPFSGGEGWLYWHIPSSSMQFSVGDSVYTGDMIGRVATWSVYSFHHVHFNKVDGSGGYPWSWYTSTDNPFLYLEPYDDPDAPFFRNAIPGQKFAFAQNNTSTYLSPANLSGAVDIIANIGDIINDPEWPESPFQVRYWIDGPQSTDPVISFLAANLCPSDNTINVCYQEDNTCTTQGNYDIRDYYFNVTNTDGDGVIETTDSNNSWNTDLFPAGDYWVMVEASDRYGNVTLDSMMVALSGGPDFSIDLQPVNPPIILPAGGGQFNYNITLSNNGGGGSADLWLMAELPDGRIVGPLMLVQNVFVGAGSSIARERTQVIPAGAPAGEYYYYFNIGDYPSIIVGSSGFNFTKEP